MPVRRAQVGQHGDPSAVVHLPVGGHPEDRGQQAEQQHGDRRAVVGQGHRVGDLDLVLTERGRQQRGDRQDEHQGGPHQRLDEGEGAAAQLVGHLEAEQGVAGHPRDAGPDPDEQRGEGRGHHVRDQGEQRQGQPGRDDGQAEQPPPAEVGHHPRPDEHADGEADEHGAEQQAVAAARRPRGRRTNVRASPITAPPAANAPSIADDQPADEPGAADEAPALDQGAPDGRRVRVLGVAGCPRRDLGQPHDGQGRDQERRRVDEQRQVDLVDRATALSMMPDEQREAGEDGRRDRRRAVGR